MLTWTEARIRFGNSSDASLVSRTGSNCRDELGPSEQYQRGGERNIEQRNRKQMDAQVAAVLVYLLVVAPV